MEASILIFKFFLIILIFFFLFNGNQNQKSIVGKARIIDGDTIRRKILEDRDASRGFREWPPKGM